MSLGLAIVGCDRDYPISATFCDDWCEATVKGCPSYDPAQCVAACEADPQLRTESSCSIERLDLIHCAQLAPEDELICVSEIREGGPCAAESDALFTCNSGGAEGIMAFACESLCGAIAYAHSDEPDAVCPGDCIQRGLGRPECEPERSQATSCLYSSCRETDVELELCSMDDCERQLADLDTCGARQLQAE